MISGRGFAGLTTQRSVGVASRGPRGTEPDLLVDKRGRATLRAVDPFEIG